MTTKEPKFNPLGLAIALYIVIVFIAIAIGFWKGIINFLF